MHNKTKFVSLFLSLQILLLPTLVHSANNFNTVIPSLVVSLEPHNILAQQSLLQYATVLKLTTHPYQIPSSLQTALDSAYLCMGENNTHHHISTIKDAVLLLFPNNINRLNFKTKNTHLSPFSNTDWSKSYCLNNSTLTIKRLKNPVL